MKHLLVDASEHKHRQCNGYGELDVPLDFHIEMLARRTRKSDFDGLELRPKIIQRSG